MRGKPGASPGQRAPRGQGWKPNTLSGPGASQSSGEPGPRPPGQASGSTRSPGLCWGVLGSGTTGLGAGGVANPFRFPSLASVCSVCLFCSEGDFTLLSFGPRGTCILPLTPASQSAGGRPGDALGRRKMGSGHQISATESPGPPAIRVISGLATICSLWSFTCQGHSGAGKRGGAGGWSEAAEVRTCLRASAVTAPWSGQGHGVSGPMNGRGVQMAVNRLRPVLGCRSCVEPQSRSGTQLPRASAAARSGAERPRPPCSSCGPVWGSTSFFHWLTSTASLSSREAAGEK